MATGGTFSKGGMTSTGGSASVGGSKTTGGTFNTGGAPSTGGAASLGGNAAATGGTKSAGGAASTGGAKSAGGTASTGGTKSVGTTNTGGKTSTGGATSTGGTTAAGGGGAVFNWGIVTYSVTGGSGIGHQGHDTGQACLASCHNHAFQTGGTIYQANGTTTAANVQVGIIMMNGTLMTTYSGSQGNFYLSLSGTQDWSTAQVAIRTATGTSVHPTVAAMSGNCNSAGCHDSSNRIVVP
jgi:hypothetical protein